jgi:hypothetical protein
MGGPDQLPIADFWLLIVERSFGRVSNQQSEINNQQSAIRSE